MFFYSLYSDVYFPSGRDITSVMNPCRIQHPPWCNNCRCISVFVGIIYDFTDTALDDRLWAFVARKKWHIYLTALQTAAAIIQNGIQFTVGNVKILCIQFFTFAPPWKNIIRAAPWKTVISNRQNLVLLTYNAGAHLTVRILRSEACQLGHAHKILIQIGRASCRERV